MTVRVNADEVKEIIETSLGDSVIEAFITAANLSITGFLTGSGLSANLLKELERWLTAHLIACARERQVDKETVGQADITYSGKTGMGLDATLYGQQVKLLDTTGILANQVGKRQASIFAVTSFEEDEDDE